MVDHEHTTNDIAVIGLAGRFPGAPTIDAFGANLRAGKESIAALSREELAAASVDQELLNHPDYVPAGGFLDDIDLFDAQFFKYAPREAEGMDPQQRLFLECAWEALETAGYGGERRDQRVGVFAGASTSEYAVYLDRQRGCSSVTDTQQAATGVDKDFIATRVAYKLDLRGPGITVQTACSTSLVAVHLAGQSLLLGDCDMALAGGVSIALATKRGYLYQEGGILSPDGHCRPFDAAARGTVGGSGLGIVVLKRLADALADGDPIRAVIKSSAINNDGSLKAGFTAPSIDGQRDVIAEALALAGVPAESISYLEAHGTGTIVGDPIEIAALTAAFREFTDRRGYCALGSVKSNIGHLDAAAGVAGLIKTILALEQKLLFPSLHCERANPAIDFASTPFYVNTRLAEWKVNGGPRRAGVSSFGIGGTNAHVVLEEAPPRDPLPPSRRLQLLVLSGRTPGALTAAGQRLARHLEAHPSLDLADVAYTLQVGRKAFPVRQVLICPDRDDALLALSASNSPPVASGTSSERAPSIVFMFPGQGTQEPGMGADLYRSEPVFAEWIDTCARQLEAHLGLDLRSVLYPAPGHEESARAQLRQTELAQPALFTVEYALAQLWMNWGIRPCALIGHSIGEYVAACLAGVFSLPDALRLVTMRGRLMQALPSGAMLAVPMREDDLLPLLGDDLSLAAVNGPARCVVSGNDAAITTFATSLATRGIDSRRLATSHAFHSSLMSPILRPFGEYIRSTVPLNAPTIPYISNLTGSWVDPRHAMDPEAWSAHLRHTVRFSAGVQELLREPGQLFLEVGPGRTLSGLVRQHDCSGATVVASLPPEPDDDSAAMLTALGRLWLEGVEIDWPRLAAGEQRRRVRLPTYPFEHQRYWPSGQERIASAPHPAPRTAEPASVADLALVPSWMRTTQRLPSHRRSASWLVFADHAGIGQALIDRLRTRGHRVVAVRHCSAFQQCRPDEYAIAPTAPRDYQTLVQRLRTEGDVPECIVHLWSLDWHPGVRSGSALSTTELVPGLLSALFLAQALAHDGAPVRDVNLITSDVESVTGDETIEPLSATLNGACRVIPLEYPTIRCRQIDISRSQPSPEGRVVEQLLNEIATDPVDPVVAYRGNHRWVRRFERMRLEELRDGGRQLRTGAVYLITGGLGGIGLTLGRYLGRAAHARLVLTSRSAFPARDHWQQWLRAHPGDDATSERIRLIRAIEEDGGQVVVRRADAGSWEHMEALIAEIDTMFGGVDGVIHAAGIPDGGLVQRQTVESIGAALAAKVRGTLILDELLRGRNLDFFVLCSSLTAISGGYGQVGYTAANAFLDAFAQHAAQRSSSPVMSVDWGAWREVGMAATVRREGGHVQDADYLATSLAPNQGVEAFHRLLANPLPQVAITPVDPSTLLRPAEPLAAAVLPETLAGREPAEAQRTETVESPSTEAVQDDLEATLAALWTEILGLSGFSGHDDFFELGGDSLMAIHLLSRLRATFGVQLHLHQLLAVPTLHGMTQAVWAQLAVQVGAATIDALLGEFAERPDDMQKLPMQSEHIGKESE